MELRGHDDDSDGDDFLPHHRRLDLGHLYPEGELGAMPPSSLASAPAPAPIPSSLTYNHSGILASGSAFRRPLLFPSPLSSSPPPPAASTPSSHRQSQHSHQQRSLLTSAGEELGGGSSEEASDNSPRPTAVQLPSSLDPNLSLVGERPEPQQRQHQGEVRKDHPPDAGAPKPFPAAVGAPHTMDGGGPSSTRADTAAAARTRARGPSAASSVPRTLGSGPTVRYRECLKNHAARIGGHVLDGCGEFMPSGEEGTTEALKCAACACHRSFHRKEVEGGEEAEGLFLPLSSASPPGAQRGALPCYYIPGGVGNGAYPGGTARGGGSGVRNLHNPQPLSLQTPFTAGRQKQPPRLGLLPPGSSGAGFPPSMSGAVNFAGGHDDEENNYSGGTTTTESSSEEMQAHMLAAAGVTPFRQVAHSSHPFQASHAVGMGEMQHYQIAGGPGSASGSAKKRHRTKFTAEQKEMMAEFAERVGWRMQKQDDGALERFCREAGVSRQVFKVWMHNNKNVVLKSKQPQGDDQQQQQHHLDDRQQPQPQQPSSSST